MQDREYVYARRVWRRPADGGCYALSMPCRHPAAPLCPGSVKHVTDHASGFRIRAAPSAQGSSAGVLLVRRNIFRGPPLNVACLYMGLLLCQGDAVCIHGTSPTACW